MSNTSKHSAGPWVGKVKGKWPNVGAWDAQNDDATLSGCIAIRDANNKVVALVVEANDGDSARERDHEANAHLIASAPKLVQALVEVFAIVDKLEPGFGPLHHAREIAKKAIANARGVA